MQMIVGMLLTSLAALVNSCQSSAMMTLISNIRVKVASFRLSRQLSCSEPKIASHQILECEF